MVVFPSWDLYQTTALLDVSCLVWGTHRFWARHPDPSVHLQESWLGCKGTVVCGLEFDTAGAVWAVMAWDILLWEQWKETQSSLWKGFQDVLQQSLGLPGNQALALLHCIWSLAQTLNGRDCFSCHQCSGGMNPQPGWKLSCQPNCHSTHGAEMSFFNDQASLWRPCWNDSLTECLRRCAPRGECLWWHKSSFPHYLGISGSRSLSAQ